MFFTELKPGKSVYERDIQAFKSDVKASKYLYLIGGTHGDEVEGVYVLDQLFKWLQSDEVQMDLPIVCLPILNVDGHEGQTRVNAHGVDLNRNYPTSNWDPSFEEDKYNPGPEALSEPENQYLIKLLDKFPPYLVLSFHSWKPTINYNGDSKDVAEFLSRYNNYSICDDIGYPTPGSFGTFVPEKYGAGVITFECPLLKEGKTLKEIWEENEQGLKAFFSGPRIDELKNFNK